ncbi:hypothetical protein A8B84_14800 [Marinobacter sp. EhC06]|uniref:restriction endonuclease n=1 Tax=Marinobacter TaxID=2742 RepID=UPI0007D9902A|nr:MULTISPECIES: restriction endonuclease [unclassified Marinobacter]OAN87463.1 hypothetical protein A8B80_09505 [Marinobacter sp. EhN04]OAN87636.1 hypothetical protein A8B84_14800 [Marinobacter sp. EhC06]
MLKRLFGFAEPRNQGESHEISSERLFVELKGHFLDLDFLQTFEMIGVRLLGEHKSGFSESIKTGVQNGLKLNELFKDVVRPSLVNDFEDYNEASFLAQIIEALCFHEKCLPIVSAHKDVLASKFRQLVYRDEFGDEQYEPWNDYIESYYERKLKDQVFSWFLNNESIIKDSNHIYNKTVDFGNDVPALEDDESMIETLDSAMVMNITSYIINLDVDGQINYVDHEDFEGTGHEYEYHLLKRIQNEAGLRAEVTSGSGDQGADLLVYNGDGTLVVQAKHYKAPVGNKAVQEVYSALKYYNGDCAVVVTNGGYTKSAIELARRTGVLCLSERELMHFLGASTPTPRSGEAWTLESFISLVENSLECSEFKVFDVDLDNVTRKVVVAESPGDSIAYVMGRESIEESYTDDDLDIFDNLIEQYGSILIFKIVPTGDYSDLRELYDDIESRYEDESVMIVLKETAIEALKSNSEED